MRRLLAFLLALTLALAGCGGSSEPTTSAAPGNQPATGTSSAATSSTDCPTENTRSFAKTRFVADVGGAAFLIRRYIYQPYTQGKLTKGASGRTIALVKAAAAAAASAKLLKNATTNAQANPTLCKTIAGPLAKLSSSVSGLTGLRSGNLDVGTLTGLGSGISGLLDAAGKAGIPVKETPTDLG